MQHRPLSILLSPGLIVLAGCPVEQTYADFIEKYGGTYSSQSASESDGDTVTTSGQGTPTTTAGPGGGAEAGASSGDNGLTTDAGLGSDTSTGTTESWFDEVPVLGEFVVTPDPVLAAGFIELSADCTDDVGVAELRFLVDGQLLAALTEPPFAAKWLVKSQDQVGDHTLAAECEDTAGQVVSTGEEISVALPAPGSVAWSKVHEAFKGNAEAADAAAASDGSWWVCGYTDNLSGGTAVWVAHYSPAGKQLFSKTISRGKDQTGRCSGIDVASDDGHRAVLTGGYGPTGLWPSLWTALIDETEVQPVLAESNDALVAYWGNDVLVNKYGQFEVAGQRIVNNNDLEMAHQVYTYTPGENELAAGAGLTYGFPKVPDIASTIVQNQDGTVTLVGTLSWDNRPRAAAVKLDAQHHVVETDEWPFKADLPLMQSAGALDGAVDEMGNLRLTGWWRESPNQDSKILSLVVDPAGYQVGELEVEQSPKVGDNKGMGVAILSDGSAVTVASVTTAGLDNLDMWLRRGQGEGGILFQGPYNRPDEPHRVRANPFDQTLVVGYETAVILQDGMPTVVRRGWLRAFD